MQQTDHTDIWIIKQFIFCTIWKFENHVTIVTDHEICNKTQDIDLSIWLS